MTSLSPWVCPRCDRVYSPNHPVCGSCNLEVEKKIEAGKVEGVNKVLRTHGFRNYELIVNTTADNLNIEINE